jgi:glycosyltransferase involved in cell wall biosynthesis
MRKIFHSPPSAFAPVMQSSQEAGMIDARVMTDDAGKNRIALIIPVYNHEKTVARVAREALDLGWPVFVVDDGSADSSWQSAKTVDGITVLHHPVNRGKGAAIMTGFAAAAPQADWAVTIDADGQHHAEDVPNLVCAIPPGRRPIIVGRREGMMDPHVPWTSRFGRHFSNFWVRLSGGPTIGDSQSGMRLYPLPEAMNLNVRARRFDFEVEILVQAHWQGIPVLETPVRVTYEPGEQRISHFRPFVDFLRNTRAFSRLIMTRILVRPFR